MRRFLQNGWDILLRFLGACTALSGMGDIRVLWMLMALDYITGLLLAFFHKTRKGADGGFSLKACLMGLGKKGMMIALLFLADALDRIGGSDGMLRRAAVGFYTVQEGISMMGNAVKFGVPIPQSIKNTLNLLKEGKPS